MDIILILVVAFILVIIYSFINRNKPRHLDDTHDLQDNFKNILEEWNQNKYPSSQYLNGLNFNKPPNNKPGRIEDLDTMDIPNSGYSAEERRREYRRRGKSPSGVIDGVYNDMNLPPGVSYNDTNRDWDAGA